MSPRRLILPALLTLALVPAACGEDEEEAPAGSGAAATATPTPEPTAEADNTDTDTKPVVEVPAGEPPAELVIDDIVEGKGRAAKPGDRLTMHYVGVSGSTAQEFDASWDRGQPFKFELGAGEVIRGWDQGIEGMRAGGRRQLVIPPELGYGASGSPPAIGPDETLVFVVDLVDIE